MWEAATPAVATLALAASDIVLLAWLPAEKQTSGHDTALFPRLVLGCINADFCNQIFIFSALFEGYKIFAQNS